MSKTSLWNRILNIDHVQITNIPFIGANCSNSLNHALCNLTFCHSWLLRYDLWLLSNSFSQRTLIKFAISSKWKSFPPNYRWWKMRPFCLSRKIASIIVCWVVEWVSNSFVVAFCVLFSSTGNIFNLHYS